MPNTILSNPLLVPIVVVGLIAIISLVMCISMRRRLKGFLVDIDSKNIADSLTIVSKNVTDLQSFTKQMEEYLTNVEKRLRKSAQSIHTVRFNPFHGTGGGGNQSFATAIINELGDGVVISSLYSREHVSVYSKPVSNFISEHELSTEEKEALAKARQNLKA